MATWYIQDLNEYQLLITDGLRAWHIPKFRIHMVVEEPYLYLHWNDREQGDGGDERQLVINYEDVVDGYGGYVDNPTSATALKTTIEGYIVSGFGGSSGDILTAKADLLSHDGVSDTILPGGANETVLTRDNSEATGLKWIAKTDIVSGGLSVTDSSTIDFTKTGGDITGAVKLSAAAGNAIIDSTGLYAPDVKWTHVGHYGTSFADSTTLYFAGSAFLPTTANASQWGIRMQRDTLITEAQVVFSSATVIGSNENISIYIRVNDTTDYLIATVGSTDRARVFYNGAMNGGAGIALVSGDYVCIKVVPPAWGTNPTNTHMDGYWRALQT